MNNNQTNTENLEGPVPNAEWLETRPGINGTWCAIKASDIRVLIHLLSNIDLDFLRHLTILRKGSAEYEIIYCTLGKKS
jgi:hypothetical protein